tara:strand:+ start:1952 stop:2449 length:498 start_codon:yes stop_codon:yes gene_type:complete
MVGPFAVGKTSLVRRFVDSIFSDNYLTTIGVKISKKVVQTTNHQVNLMIWDIEGVDIFTALKPSNLRGAAGIFLVLDGTRANSLEIATDIHKTLCEYLPNTPIVCLLNKSDLSCDWKLGSYDLQELEKLGMTTIRTSAKTGENVERAFQLIVDEMELNSGGSKAT